MKKALTIIFLFIYVILTVGLNIIIHTCGGESETLLALSTYEDPCGCAEGMETDICCSTEFTSVKIDEVQNITSVPTFHSISVSDVLFPQVISHGLFQDSDVQTINFIPFSPPPNNDLNIINSVFLI